MERRSFLAKTTVAGTVAVASLAGCGEKKPKAVSAPAIVGSSPAIKWRMASAYPKGKDVITFEDAEEFCNLLRSATGGNFDMRVYPAGELVPSSDVLDAAQQGTVECAHTSSSYHNDKDKTFNLGSTIPFGMSTRQFTSWWHAAGGRELFNEFYAKYNVYAVQIGNTGGQMGGWFKKEVKTVADFKGLRMRNAGYGSDILNKMGAVASYIPAGDIAAAFGRGDLDSAEYSCPFEDEGLGLSKFAKYYYAPGWWETAAPSQIFVNKNEWAKLPKEYQDAFESIASHVVSLELGKYDKRNPEALARLVQQGVELREFSSEIMEAAYAIAQEIYKEESAKNPAFAKIYDSQARYMAASNTWLGLCEGRMDAFMQSRKK